MPVISYINSCLEKQNTDNSLIRHFVTEVSEVVSASLFSKTFDRVSLVDTCNKHCLFSLCKRDQILRNRKFESHFADLGWFIS